MKLDAGYVALVVGICVAALLFVTFVSPDVFAIDRVMHNDVVFGLVMIGVAVCLPGAMLVTSAGRDYARRYYGGPMALFAVFAGLVAIGTYFIVYGRAGLGL